MDTLRRDGVVRVAPMPADDLAEMLAYLDECTVWSAHVAGKADQTVTKKLSEARTDGAWAAFAPTMESVICAPHFFECALRCLPIAEEYFGEAALLYSVNAFWTQPASGQYEETHNWHRDGDDRRQFGMFMFGADVDDASAHLYQRGTHRLPNGDPPLTSSRDGSMHPHDELRAAQGGEFQDPPPEAVIRVTGPAGTIFLEDPNGTHMGLRPTKLRMFAWARFGVSDPPPSYAIDKLQPVPRALLGDRYPADPAVQNAIRLVVA